MTREGDRLPEEDWPDVRALPRSMFGAPLCTDLSQLSAQVAFLGVPHDLGAGVPGARLGPNGMRDARAYVYAANDGRGTAVGYYDIELDRDRLVGVTMADCGNVTILPADVERNFWRVTRTVREILAHDTLLVVLGGDHSITPAVVRGFDRFERVDIVHLDAHVDFHDHVQGIRWTNGMSIRRCAEYPWVGEITQIGLRVIKTRRSVEDARSRGNRIVTADRFRELGPEAAIAVVPESRALYVTFDIDVLDATLCRGTGSPEFGGLTFLEMRAALRALARRAPIVGIDVVEVSPMLDDSGFTAKVASELLVGFLADIFEERTARKD
jgi:agmatinase